MNQYAGTLIVCVCLGAVAAVGAGCDSASDDSGSAGSPATSAGTGNTTGGTGSGVSGSTSVAGTSPGTGGTGTATGTPVPLPSDMTGFVDVPTLGIMGAWYPYGDGIGPDALPADGDCEKAGHAATDCSTITTPVPSAMTFTNTNSVMCTSGTVAKVLSLMGKTDCPTVSADCDYSAMFGAGIGLDLNNGGNDGGTGKQPFNATTAGVIGISFDIVDMTGTAAAVPLTGLRIEFPTPTTTDTAAIWKWQKAKNYTSPVVMGHNQILFSDVTQPDYVAGYSAATAGLDVTKIVSVQFHVPTTTGANGPYSFCVGNFSAITM
jgi:hypothetical protein